MIKRKYAVIGAILLFVVTALGSSLMTQYIIELRNIQNGDKIVITRAQYEQLQSIEKLEQVKSIIKNEYIKKVDDEELMAGAVKGLVSSLGDPYSVYFTPEEFQEFQEHTRGTYAGVGLLVTVDPNDKLITVVQAFKNSPSAKAGILPGDKIVKVGDTELDGTMLDKAVSMMKGPQGTKVKVTVYRNGEFKDYELERDIIVIETVEGKVISGDIGYVRITTFDENTDKSFTDTIKTLEKEKIKGLIIDLRDNPGGLLQVVTKMADTLLPEGMIVYTEDRAGKQEVINSDAKMLGLPLVVLVNGNSASASEILAGAIQDYGVGRIVGTKTFGKGIVQSVKFFKDGSGLKITTSRYFTPKGRSIHEVGIHPDVVIDLPEDLKKDPTKITEDNDVQLKKAIEELETLMKK